MRLKQLAEKVSRFKLVDGYKTKRILAALSIDELAISLLVAAYHVLRRLPIVVVSLLNYLSVLNTLSHFYYKIFEIKIKSCHLLLSFD